MAKKSWCHKIQKTKLTAVSNILCFKSEFRKLDYFLKKSTGIDDFYCDSLWYLQNTRDFHSITNIVIFNRMAVCTGVFVFNQV